MLALRSVLVIAGDDERVYGAAATTAADGVLFDLAAPAALRQRATARGLVERYAPAAAKARRAVIVRVGDTRSGELDTDIDAIVGRALTAVVLPGVELPQDARDADVAIRKREMRRGVAPGSIRLIAEIDSAAGLRSLPTVLDAVDRHGAVALDVAGLLAEMGIVARRDSALNAAARAALEEHAMADVAIAARSAGLPWIVSGRDAAALASRAHDLGAAGVTLQSEAEALGMNALFAPDPLAVDAARAILAEWERVRAVGRWRGAVGEGAEVRLVDRRSVRAARAVLARAEAIERRDAAR